MINSINGGPILQVVAPKLKLNQGMWQDPKAKPGSLLMWVLKTRPRTTSAERVASVNLALACGMSRPVLSLQPHRRQTQGPDSHVLYRKQEKKRSCLPIIFFHVDGSHERETGWHLSLLLRQRSAPHWGKEGHLMGMAGSFLQKIRRKGLQCGLFQYSRSGLLWGLLLDVNHFGDIGFLLRI